MRMKEMQDAFLKGDIEKKLYWTLMRENYTHILPEIKELLKYHEECKSICITGDEIVLVKRSGLKLFFNFNGSFSRAEIDLCNAVDPERDDMRIISELLSEREVEVALDIGANVGMFSLELYQEHPDIHYYLFEPIPTTYENLLRTIKLNEVDEGKIQPYNLGMSNIKGSFKFFLPGESEAASLQPIDDTFYRKKSDKFGNYNGTSEMKEVECQVTTVDDFVDNNNLCTVGFLKIDVEGNEKFVLKGAERTLRKFHPLVYCELLRKHAKRFGYNPNDVIAFMKEVGYSCKTVRNSKLVYVDEINEYIKETNFIFVID